MKKKFLSLGLASILLACNTPKEDNSLNKNPLLSKNFETPYEVPAFSDLTPSAIEEAMLEGIKEQKSEILDIVKQTDAPTWKNNLLAIENSGKIYSRASRIFNNLNSAHTNGELKAIAQRISSKAAAHTDFIYMNADLYQRVAKVWEHREKENLNAQQLKVLENTYKRFVRSGANLNKNQQQKLAKINADIAELTTNFGQNILEDSNAFSLRVENEQDLIGIPEAVIEATAEKSPDKENTAWVFGLQNSIVMPVLAYAENRSLREKIYKAYKNRGNNNNEFNNSKIAIQLANLCLQKANLLGYDSYADYALENTMAKDRESVNTFLEKLWRPSLKVAQREIDQIASMMKEEGIEGEVEPWDYKYYLEKIKEEQFQIDNQELAEYFSLEQVQNGIFRVTEKLYGLQFEELTDVPVYQEDVTAWKVSEANGTHVGILYMDLHQRSSKRGGAWMTSFRPQSKKDGKRYGPIISINCNFSEKVENHPTLLSLDEVTTFFHEFGHALHGLLSDVEYQSLAGTNVPRDFVELPSQIMENWATDPEVLKMYAFHYETGELIPDNLIQKLEDLGTFGQGFATTEYLASALLDMKFHSITDKLNTDTASFEVETLTNLGMPEAITARHSSTHFSHIFAGGYSAGYYSYIWSGVLDSDAFNQFKQTDLFNQEKANSFRKNVLETGGTQEPMELYKKFRGSEPSIEPLLKKRGLDDDSYGSNLKG
ncbi:M3 family metallopeptidase [Psychroflexus salis]|uniref:Dipeptidyl carboxypeptidase II n=1 Tax=Psychroflexus salis TaxID=1526574 RepID=A0A916ZQS4_9FLAO|nr:M3 family metallopeptidase [Psychroflexus salis]GGE07667.1 dipeptidyl carboxypeptidase II [Psychroflexus salis]